jgi:hypothetical protein
VSVRTNFTLIRGQDVILEVKMTPPKSISGYSITFQVKDSIGGTSRITKTVGSGITVTNTGKGVIQISLAAANTSSLSIQSYVWDIRRTDSGYNRELAGGELNLVKGVTE